MKHSIFKKTKKVLGCYSKNRRKSTTETRTKNNCHQKEQLLCGSQYYSSWLYTSDIVHALQKVNLFLQQITIIIANSHLSNHILGKTNSNVFSAKKNKMKYLFNVSNENTLKRVDKRTAFNWMRIISHCVAPCPWPMNNLNSFDRQFSCKTRAVWIVCVQH